MRLALSLEPDRQESGVLRAAAKAADRVSRSLNLGLEGRTLS